MVEVEEEEVISRIFPQYLVCFLVPLCVCVCVCLYACVFALWITVLYI